MNVTVAAGEWCPELDLEPDTIVTVTFVDEDVPAVEVVVIGPSAPVRWTCDGTDPGEDVGFYVPLDGTDERQPPTSGPTVVKLWTSGTAKACVQRA